MSARTDFHAVDVSSLMKSIDNMEQGILELEHPSVVPELVVDIPTVSRQEVFLIVVFIIHFQPRLLQSIDAPADGQVQQSSISLLHILNRFLILHGRLSTICSRKLTPFAINSYHLSEQVAANGEARSIELPVLAFTAAIFGMNIIHNFSYVSLSAWRNRFGRSLLVNALLTSWSYANCMISLSCA